MLKIFHEAPTSSETFSGAASLFREETRWVLNSMNFPNAVGKIFQIFRGAIPRFGIRGGKPTLPLYHLTFLVNSSLIDV
jgi:hypothetical protein